jgi:aminoacyl tRNA synthase complex-interacting multifunctional protein 1
MFPKVCAGLKPYLTADQLLQRLVVLVVNLKPAKLAGELSEAMILAADAKAVDGSTLVSPDDA